MNNKLRILIDAAISANAAKHCETFAQRTGEPLTTEHKQTLAGTYQMIRLIAEELNASGAISMEELKNVLRDILNEITDDMLTTALSAPLRPVRRQAIQ